MLQSTADWFARTLSIIAILISVTFLLVHIWQARKQRPIVKIEESDITISPEFDEASRKANFALTKEDYKPALPQLSIPVEINLYLRNTGFISTGISDMEFSIEYKPNGLLETLKLFLLEKLHRHGRCLGGNMYFGAEPPFLYLQPSQSPLTLPYTLECGQMIKCTGVLSLDLLMPNDVLEAYKLHKSELKTPLDCFDFVISARGLNTEEVYFRLCVFAGKHVLCNAVFHQSMWRHWFCA